MNYFLIVVLLLSVGCASHKPSVTVIVPSTSGTTLSSSEIECLRSGEIIKKYYVGAYTNPSHPQIRHYPHMVERIEQISRWNLRPNTPVVASGPTYKAVEENALKNAMQQQYDDEIKKQKAANTEVQAQTAALKQEISDLKKMEDMIATLNTKVASLEEASSNNKSKVSSSPPFSMGSSRDGNFSNQPSLKSTTSSQQGTESSEVSVQ